MRRLVIPSPGVLEYVLYGEALGRVGDEDLGDEVLAVIRQLQGGRDLVLDLEDALREAGRQGRGSWARGLISA